MDFSTYIKILRRLFVILLLVCTLTGCNARFFADFESDTIGQTPDLSPPSLVADQVVMLDFDASEGEGVQVRVESWPFQGSTQSRETKSVRFDFPITPATEQGIRLESSPMATSSQLIFSAWEQVILGDGIAQFWFLAENPQDPDTAVICECLTLTDAAAIDCGEERSEIRGFDTAEPHSLLLTLNRALRQASLSVFQNFEAIGSESVSIGEAILPAEGEELWVQVRYFGQTEGMFHINSFSISERDPS